MFIYNFRLVQKDLVLALSSIQIAFYFWSHLAPKDDSVLFCSLSPIITLIEKQIKTVFPEYWSQHYIS